MLDPRPGEKIADLFCGLGNFTLAIASRGAHAHGVEGYAPRIARAEENARANGLEKLASFSVADLFVDAETTVRNLGKPDKLLIDPPRDGALDICKSLPEPGPRTIVYVSCSPATLARDAGVLVHVKGYRLVAAGVVNMFPHTAHVESIAHFEKSI
jgi:23S rRNA (uracil1939-C5)-methyltransferase